MHAYFLASEEAIAQALIMRSLLASSLAKNDRQVEKPSKN